MIQLNAARKRKQRPPLNSVQLGVQIRLTIGQMPVKCNSRAEADSDRAGNEKPLHWDGRRRSAKPASGDQAQNHRAQSRNEAEGQITALVVDKRLRSWKQVEKPLIESMSQVAVLVPMRGEAAEVVTPVRGHADCRVIEIAPGAGYKRPSQPVAEQNQRPRLPTASAAAGMPSRKRKG